MSFQVPLDTGASIYTTQFGMRWQVSRRRFVTPTQGIANLTLTIHSTFKEARKSFASRGDWFQVNAIPITMAREIERTGNERCKFTINLS